MISDYLVVLDACVMVPAALRDTLLRLAEKRLYLPRWTDMIIAEMVRTLQGKIGKTEMQTNHLTAQLKTYFVEAWVADYEPIIPSCHNHEKDRHVLAAAIKSNAELIVTFNIKHFPKSAVEPWNIEVIHPDEFLIDIFHLNPPMVIHTLHEQAQAINSNIDKLLFILNQGTPKFVQLISETLQRADF